MKTRVSILVILAMVTLGIAPVKAQDHPVKFHLDYNFSFPVGSMTSGFISNTSSRGFLGSVTYDLTPHWTIGGQFGFQDYYQKYPRRVYNTDKTQQISAVMSNSLQTIPVMARVEYQPLLSSQSRVLPYVSLATGINLVSYNQYLGVFSNQQQSTLNFRAQAGLGARMSLGKTGKWGIEAGGSYVVSPYNKFGVKDLNNLNAHAGIYLRLQ